jgi:hypothetical protein
MKRKMGKLSAGWWKLGTRSFHFGQDQTEKHSSRKATETQEMAVVEVEDEMKWKKRAVVLFKDAISLMNLGKEMKRRISSISMGLNATEWRPSSRGMRSELLSRVAVFRVHAPKIYYLFTSWPFHSLPRPQSHRVIG